MNIAAHQQMRAAGTALCKDCGLCCTGHLFAWTKLRSAELKDAEALGLKVLGAAPNKRGFNQPCPLWHGECTIYTSPHYPHFCRQYKCVLLKKLMDERVSLGEALVVVQQTKEMIRDLESMLPESDVQNFRERLVHELEHGKPDAQLQATARRLLFIYNDQFGVKDLTEQFDAP